MKSKCSSLKTVKVFVELKFRIAMNLQIFYKVKYFMGPIKIGKIPTEFVEEHLTNPTDDRIESYAFILLNKHLHVEDEDSLNFIWSIEIETKPIIEQ